MQPLILIGTFINTTLIELDLSLLFLSNEFTKLILMISLKQFVVDLATGRFILDLNGRSNFGLY